MLTSRLAKPERAELLNCFHIRKDYDLFRQYSHPASERGDKRRERLVICGAREGEERKDPGRGRGAAARSAGAPEVGPDRAAGTRGEEDVPVRGGAGERRDLARRMGEAGGAASPVRRNPGVGFLIPLTHGRITVPSRRLTGGQPPLSGSSGNGYLAAGRSSISTPSPGDSEGHM